MTTEEKAKAYDEALKWIRELYPGLHGATKEDAEHYFPELRESEDEDERIRKMCIAAVNIAASADGGLLHSEASECLSWLEEQKDKNCLACDQHLKGYLAGRKTTEAEKQKEIPMPNSTELVEMWEDVEATLKEHENDPCWGTWRIAYNAFLEGFGKGFMVKRDYFEKHISKTCKENADSFTDEDERIRKWIIEELEITRDAMSGKNPYSDDPDIVARLKRLDEAIYYLDGQKDFAANEYWRGFGNGRDEVIANPDAFNLQKEQKPIGIYWHKIKEGEKLPCRAYVWNIDYEKHYDCFEGRLIANLENISVGRDTWYLPADDVRNLPREGVDELPREQKPDIELIQRSWYMEGYHDRKFGMEPRWIIKTEEGGPKHEPNPKYGHPLAEQQYYSKLNDLERAIHRGFLSAGVENVPVTIIKETAKDCLAHMPAEWSEEDEEMWMDIKSHMIHGSFIPFDKIEWIENRLNSLQQGQPTVDFERDAVQFCFDKGLNITPYQAKTIARHFYELGLNTRKEENK